MYAKTTLLFSLSYLINLSLNAQVGIGTTSPAASAQLEVSSSNKGILTPRINLTSLTDNSTITSPATGLLIFNTATAGTSPNNVTPGFYYYNGTKWQRILNHEKQLTKNSILINNAAATSSSGLTGATNISNWTGTYVSSGGDVVVTANFTAYSGVGGIVTVKLLRDGTAVSSRNFYFNNTGVHHTMPTLVGVFDNESGSHTYGVRIETNITVDLYDYCTILVEESDIP